MTDYKKMVVIENGQTVFIQDDYGVSVTFSNFEEALAITGVDFTGKFYVGYEPHINLFRDSRDESITSADIPNVQYEGFISNVAMYLSRHQDPYYGLPTEEALANSKVTQRSIILAQYQVKEDLLEIELGGNSYHAGVQHITELFVEYELAVLNSETQMVVFDTNDEPHNVAIGVVISALQDMRSLAKDLRILGRNYLADINNAATREEVEAVVWV